MAEDVDPAKSGHSTSEFHLTAVAMVMGAVLEGLGAILQQLQSAGVSAPWFTAALAIIGAAVQISALFGYQRSRTIVKAEQIRADAKLP